MIEQYIKEIIAVGEFLKKNPNYSPNGIWRRELESMSPEKAIGTIVNEIYYD